MLQLKLLHAAKTEHSQIHIKEKKTAASFSQAQCLTSHTSRAVTASSRVCGAMKMREAGSQLWELKPTGVDTRDSCITGSAW